MLQPTKNPRKPRTCGESPAKQGSYRTRNRSDQDEEVKQTDKQYGIPGWRWPYPLLKSTLLSKDRQSTVALQYAADLPPLSPILGDWPGHGRTWPALQNFWVP